MSGTEGLHHQKLYTLGLSMCPVDSLFTWSKDKGLPENWWDPDMGRMSPSECSVKDQVSRDLSCKDLKVPLLSFLLPLRSILGVFWNCLFVNIAFGRTVAMDVSPAVVMATGWFLGLREALRSLEHTLKDI